MSQSRILTSRCGACGCRLRVKTHSDEKIVTCPKCGARVAVRQAGPPPDPPPPEAVVDEVAAARPDVHEFPCPNCAGALRAGRELTGRLVKCRHCGQTVRVPQSREDQEREAAQARAEEAARGRRTAVGIVAAVVATHLLSVGVYFALPDPAAVGRAVAKDVADRAAGDEGPAFFQDKQIQEMIGGNARDRYTIALMVRCIWVVGSFVISAILALFLCLRGAAARVLLGAWLILQGVLVLAALAVSVTSGDATAFRLFPLPVLLMSLDALAHLGVGFGAGVALFRSKAVAAYVGRHDLRKNRTNKSDIADFQG